MIILFGFPATRSKSADRAIGAAQALKANLESMPRRKIGAVAADITARIGIASGEAIVGYPDKDPTRGLQLVGSPVNLASGLQDLARPGTILVDEATRDLVTQDFGFGDFPATALKGFAETTVIFAVMAARQPPMASSPSVKDRIARVHHEQAAQLDALWAPARRDRSMFALMWARRGSANRHFSIAF